jgi:hypothetical protein
MNKKLILSALFLLSFLFLINFISAWNFPSDVGVKYTNATYTYTNITGGETNWNANYSQFLLNNVSLTNYIGSANTTLYQILMNGSFINVPWNATNTSYVPYTGASANVNLGNNNLTVNGSTLFIDTNNSRVGIGTTNPNDKLTITDTVASIVTANSGTRQIKFGAYAGDWNYNTAYGAPYLLGTQDANPFYIYTSNLMRLTVQKGGNVGIGTINPLTNLHVNGSILANGTINATIGFGVNGKSGITGNYTILKDVDLVGLTKTYCSMNFTGGILFSSTC